MTQSIHSRTHLFDGALPISSVEDVIELKPPQFWLNVEVLKPYLSLLLCFFYAEHTCQKIEILLPMNGFVIKLYKNTRVGFYKLIEKLERKAE